MPKGINRKCHICGKDPLDYPFYRITYQWCDAPDYGSDYVWAGKIKTEFSAVICPECHAKAFEHIRKVVEE